MLRIHNTLTKRMEEFKPVENGMARIYVCGPTVYNYFHIGNSRVFILFDAFRSYLEYAGIKTTFIQNITDIDDKIINRAKEEGIGWDEVAEKYTAAYFEDCEKLNISRPDRSPRATEEIPAMIEIIQKLTEAGRAYTAENGVYFSVESFEGYGKLSGKRTDELMEGARVDVDEGKRNPLDFALWKFSKPGEPSWESPWGKGRPGWHIECSAMSSRYLGATFDIHGGGADLIFPHHENEIAQSEAASGKPFVNYWMHAGYLNIKGEKMSKSKGNFLLVRDILKEYKAEVIRMFILSAHYRGPLDFSGETIEAIKTAHSGIYHTLQELENYSAAPAASEEGFEGLKKAAEEERAKSIKKFKEALDYDFNTPRAFGVIFEAVAYAKKILGTKGFAVSEGSKEIMNGLASWIKEMTGVFKITPEIKPVDKEASDLVKEIEILRSEKKYEEADVLKKKLDESGYMLKFRPMGPVLIRK
ncbi:MAG TPA: cysteine--tRNA ligase [bacterium]|nr:cysteine--tRNA ligase [bacterium]